MYSLTVSGERFWGFWGKFDIFRVNLVLFLGEKGPFQFVPHWNDRTLRFDFVCELWVAHID